jgi:hypothetical protein
MDRDGHTSPVSGNGNFHLRVRRLRTSLGVILVPDASRKARHEFHESPPGKAGFRISDDLLGGFSPALDQLQQRLAAIPQALAFLDLVEECDRLVRQLEQNFLRPGRSEALAETGCLEGISIRHRRERSESGC